MFKYFIKYVDKNEERIKKVQDKIKEITPNKSS